MDSQELRDEINRLIEVNQENHAVVVILSTLMAAILVNCERELALLMIEWSKKKLDEINMTAQRRKN